MHYLKKGWELGYNPSQHFNTNEYLKRHHYCKINPLYHFIQEKSLNNLTNFIEAKK